MKAFLLTLTTLSLSGSLLAVILLAVRRAAGGRLPKAFWYYAWLLVLLRLMVPLGYGIHPPEPALSAPDGAGQEALLPSAPGEAEPGAGTAGGAGALAVLPAQPQPVSVSFSPPNLSTILFLLWLLGAAGSLGWRLAAYIQFIHKLRPTLTPPPAEAQALFVQLGGGRRARLACSAAVDTPILMGLLRPVVVLPLGQEAAAAALRHELTHCRRGDILYKWLVVLTAAVHWFNPLVHWMGRRIALDCELSCDEAVLAALPPEERVGYGELLLALAARRRLPAGVTATTLCEEKRQLKARLQGILGYRKPTRGTLLLALALGMALACCACGVLDLTEEAAPPASSPTREPEAAVSDPYAALLSRYEEALTLRQPEDYPDLPAALTNPYWAWTDTDSLLDRTGWARMDLDDDGSEELLLGWVGNEFWNLDEGYVFAIYTLTDDQPVLAVEGWERSLYVLGADGYLSHCGSSGADRTAWHRYRFDASAEGCLELVEQVSVPEDGQEAIEVGDGWMASGISIPYHLFAPSEGMLQDVLLGSAPFLYWAEGAEAPVSMSVSEVPALFSPYSAYAQLYQFAVLDLDGDGAEEVVLQTSDVANDMGGYLILRQEHGAVCGYPSGWRTFWSLKTDGTFVYSHPAGSEEGTAAVRFTGTGMELDKQICAQGTCV